MKYGAYLCLAASQAEDRDGDESLRFHLSPQLASWKLELQSFGRVDGGCIVFCTFKYVEHLC